MKKKIKIFLILISLLTISCGKLTGNNPKIPGIKGPYLKFIKETASLQLKIEVELPYKKEEKVIKIPKLYKSKIKIFANEKTGNIAVEVNLDIAELISISPDAYDPMTLPGGRSLPGVRGGKLPAAAVTIPKLKNISFYIGKDVFGIFLPVPKLNKYSNITTARFRVKGKRIGNISIVGGDKNGQNAGVLLLIDNNEAIKDSLRELLYEPIY